MQMLWLTRGLDSQTFDWDVGMDECVVRRARLPRFLSSHRVGSNLSGRFSRNDLRKESPKVLASVGPPRLPGVNGRRAKIVAWQV
jgi:hypothetical protein